MREAWIRGVATAVGALIRVLPFFIWAGPTAVGGSFAISMLSHWGVGAARSVFTGRSVFRSGMDMFVVGLGGAVVGDFVGEWIGGLFWFTSRWPRGWGSPNLAGANPESLP